VAIRTEHAILIREDLLEFQAVGFLKGLLEQWNRNAEADEIVVIVRGVAPARDFQDIEAKFGIDVRKRILFIGDIVAVLFFQLWIQEGNGALVATRWPSLSAG
jgi:hypothetical protein